MREIQILQIGLETYTDEYLIKQMNFYGVLFTNLKLVWCGKLQLSVPTFNFSVPVRRRITHVS